MYIPQYQKSTLILNVNFCFPGSDEVSYLSIRILFGRGGMWDPFVSRTPC